MDELPMYPVCPHRNVAAAYERFFGPDSGGVERFFVTGVERERFYGHARQQAMAALTDTCERELHRYAELAKPAAAFVVRGCMSAMRTWAACIADAASHATRPQLGSPRLQALLHG